MAICRKAKCKEQVVYDERWGNRRFCEMHGNEFAEKIERMPDCASKFALTCQEKVYPRRADKGYTICSNCENALAARNRRHEAERTKYRLLDEAETVKQLKRWIETYVR